MKAAVMTGAGKPLEIADVRIDKPGPREVLIRTAAAGLCHSDLHVLEGSYPLNYPLILGHEAAGVVEAVGSDVTLIKPGDHVIACLSAYCGHCAECLGGRMNLCVVDDTDRSKEEPSRLSTPAGQPVTQFCKISGFAEQILTHEHAVVAIRKDMPLDLASVIGCAVMTGYGAVVRTARVEPGETVAVIGCGGIGLSAINAAAMTGAGRIIAIDTQPAKEAFARTFGATDFINAAEVNAVEAVKDLTGGGVNHAFECVGVTALAEQAFEMIRRGGVATMIGMFPPTGKITLPSRYFMGEKRIQGSYMGSNRFPIDMPRLVDFYMQGKLKLDDLVSHRLRLDQINDGFAEMKTGQFARSVVVF
jgi:S-(hydroxymethyl)glutathione dehydrogenase / alcohol dehydrogenase